MSNVSYEEQVTGSHVTACAADIHSFTGGVACGVSQAMPLDGASQVQCMGRGACMWPVPVPLHGSLCMPVSNQRTQLKGAGMNNALLSAGPSELSEMLITH